MEPSTNRPGGPPVTCMQRMHPRVRRVVPPPPRRPRVVRERVQEGATAAGARPARAAVARRSAVTRVPLALIERPVVLPPDATLRVRSRRERHAVELIGGGIAVVAGGLSLRYLGAVAPAGLFAAAAFLWQWLQSV